MEDSNRICLPVCRSSQTCVGRPSRSRRQQCSMTAGKQLSSSPPETATRSERFTLGYKVTVELKLSKGCRPATKSWLRATICCCNKANLSSTPLKDQVQL